MNKLKTKLYEVIFEADTPAGKAFDLVLLILILLSVAAVMLESISGIQPELKSTLSVVEWIITICFTIEYILRIWVVRHPGRYIFSFYGIVDFLAVLPSYIGLLLVNAHALVIIRAIRLLRIFRLFKLTRYLSEANVLMRALKASRTKISVFLFAVLTLVIIIGTVMYLVEGEAHGFTSIPKGIYWAIVTLTTVGYGDIAPSTNLGQFIASFVMILGYGIIAVPTGIVTAEIARTGKVTKPTTQYCPNCLKGNHESDAVYCKYCGEKLN